MYRHRVPNAHSGERARMLNTIIYYSKKYVKSVLNLRQIIEKIEIMFYNKYVY